MVQHWIEVLFSGAGIAIITALIWFFRRHKTHGDYGSAAKLGSIDSTQDSVMESPAVSGAYQDTTSLLTPEQIVSQIMASPPMERTQAAKRYEDLKIDSHVCLEAIYPDDDGVLATLRFSCGERRGFPVIRCRIETKLYPDLKILHEGSIFRVEGRIEKADEFTISIRDAKLTVLKGVFGRS
jgi:hypothetical protein